MRGCPCARWPIRADRILSCVSGIARHSRAEFTGSCQPNHQHRQMVANVRGRRWACGLARNPHSPTRSSPGRRAGGPCQRVSRPDDGTLSPTGARRAAHHSTLGDRRRSERTLCPQTGRCADLVHVACRAGEADIGLCLVTAGHTANGALGAAAELFEIYPTTGAALRALS